MVIRDWPPDEILRIARTSGKSLEVRCAEALLSQNWMARLGSYYADGALDVPRELDVLAERTVRLHSAPTVNARLRAVISCRDFPDDQAALTYSVLSRTIPSFRPRVIVEHHGPWQLQGVGTNSGSLREYEAVSAEHLLRESGLTTERHVIALDVVERTEVTRKGKGGKLETNVRFDRGDDGDKRIFKAIDSAIKAAQYWRGEDYRWGEEFASLTVPVLLLGRPFWNVFLDGGVAGNPAVVGAGWMSNFFPAIGTRAGELMTVIWSIDEIQRLIHALDQTFAWFTKELNQEYERVKPREPHQSRP